MSKSWTPEKVKDPAAVKLRSKCFISGIGSIVLAYVVVGPGTEQLAGWLGVIGLAMIVVGSFINVWREKKSEIGLY